MPRVLVVEDDLATREATALVLRGEGLEVEAVADGRAALERLRSGPQPDLVVLDLVMPAVDGWALREEMLLDPWLAAIPVLVCSGAPDLPARAARLRAAAVLVKPYELRDLAAQARALLGLPPARGGGMGAAP